MTASPGTLRTVAVIGAGPRGTAIIERLVAASHSESWQGQLTVHLIDPLVGRGGAVWRDDQPEVLLMNTTTCQTTMYPDDSCHALLPRLHERTLADHLRSEGCGPADFASRAAHGRYLAAVLATAQDDADPERLRIVLHPAEAVDVTGAADGPQRVRLDDGRVLAVDAAALALGHLPTALGPRSQQLADAADRHGLLHIGPANPLEIDYTRLLGRERIAVQGMGLNFYDALGMLTAAAGGRFEPDAAAPSGLRYLPGGDEPQLLVGSRSGMVYRPKPDLGDRLPAPFTPQILTGERVLELAVRAAGVDHEREVMPLILAELRRALDGAGHPLLADDQALLQLLFPFGRRGGGASADPHRRTRDVLREALRCATEPDPAWVLIHRVLVAMRIQVNRLVDLGAYTTDSVRRDIDGHLRNAFASWASGPPVIRVRQLLALEEAGLVTFTGPRMHVDIDEAGGRFAVRGGEHPPSSCDGVLEAHLPPVDLPAYRSALLGAWRERGEVQRDHWASRGSRSRMLTGSIAVDGLYCPLGADGTVYERRLLVGVPVSTAQPGSAITAEPGTAAQLLRHAEAVAVRLAHAGGALAGF